jgi:HTH-type transcriptional regulator/antitoxin HigA
MSEEKESDFKPNYAVPPGETLRETIKSLGISQSELIQQTGLPKKTINEILRGKSAITQETAIRLDVALGVPASFWNNLERYYREALARLR